MTLENTKLKEALNNYKQEHTQKNTLSLLNTVAQSAFYLPLVIEKDDEMRTEQALTIKSPDGEVYLAVFSSLDEIHKIKGFENVKTKIYQYPQLEKIILHEDNKSTNGFIIDPVTHRAKFNKNILARLRNSRQNN